MNQAILLESNADNIDFMIHGSLDHLVEHLYDELDKIEARLNKA